MAKLNYKPPRLCRLAMVSVVLLLILSSYSGSRTAYIVPQSFVPGLWVGSYTVSDFPRQRPLFYSFIFYPDKTAVTRSKGDDGLNYYGYGTWMVTKNNIVVCTTKTSRGFSQRAELSFSDKGIFKKGIWYDDYLKGKFQSLKKIK